MRTNFIRTLGATALLLTTTGAIARSADLGGGTPILYEQQLAMQEADLILTQPIAGVENHYWFDYLTDIGEARHELSTDLRHVSDSEDRRDAWEEYRHELADARQDYAKEMREKGYRVGRVEVVGD